MSEQSLKSDSTPPSRQIIELESLLFSLLEYQCGFRGERGNSLSCSGSIPQMAARYLEQAGYLEKPLQGNLTAQKWAILCRPGENGGSGVTVTWGGPVPRRRRKV